MLRVCFVVTRQWLSLLLAGWAAAQAADGTGPFRAGAVGRGNGLAPPSLLLPSQVPEEAVSGTFSIVAVDPEAGTCGAAVASKYPAVGKIVPYVRAGVGAFCTQHWHNPQWGDQALDLLAAGKGPEEVLGEMLKDDKHRDKRQLLLIDMQGRAVVRNPANPDLAGEIYWGAISGRNFACAGNMIAGRDVLVAMGKAFEESRGSLADRLMAALAAADAAGGDSRGRLAAGIRIAKKDVPGLWLDLQVERSDDAVNDLVKQYAALQHAAKGEARRPERDERPEETRAEPQKQKP